eukprot:11400560-Prorocentrum_lima.AAC.1
MGPKSAASVDPVDSVVRSLPRRARFLGRNYDQEAEFVVLITSPALAAASAMPAQIPFGVGAETL